MQDCEPVFRLTEQGPETASAETVRLPSSSAPRGPQSRGISCYLNAALRPSLGVQTFQKGHRW